MLSENIVDAEEKITIVENIEDFTPEALEELSNGKGDDD